MRGSVRSCFPSGYVIISADGLIVHQVGMTRDPHSPALQPWPTYESAKAEFDTQHKAHRELGRPFAYIVIPYATVLARRCGAV